MILRVWEKCVSACSEDNVIIATDDSQIEDHCLNFGMNVIMTSETCRTGTDRVSEVSTSLDAGFYVNVQGDEPLIDPQDIKKIIDSYRKNPDATYCAMTEIKDEEEYRSPNIPKVVTDLKNNL